MTRSATHFDPAEGPRLISPKPSPDPEDAALRAAFRKGFAEGLLVAEKALAGTSELALPKQRHGHPEVWCAACLVHSQAMAWLGKPLL